MRVRQTVWLAALLFSQLIAAVNIIYDETGWTKQDWQKYKLEYNTNFEPSPADEVIKSPEIRKALAKSLINSVDGPLPRTALSRPLGLWSSEDGTLVETEDDDSLDAAAEAVTCTVCHSVLTHVWTQVVQAIHSAEPINEDSVGDMIDDACEQAHVPSKVLQSYRIVKVEAPEAGVTMFVVRSRQVSQQPSTDSAAEPEDAGAATKLPGTEAEMTATIKSCKDMVSHHKPLLLKPVWKLAGDYFVNHKNLARRIHTKLKADADDVDEYDDPPEDEEDARLERKALQHIPEHKLLPYDALCLDMELLCPLWASLGECTANPKYMVGTTRKLGHCRASCGKCTPDTTWRDHPIAKKELAASSSSMLNSLRQTACTSTQACMSGGSGSSIPASKKTVVQNANILPGAALAKMEGFVLGKPFWGIPGIEAAPKPTPSKKAAAAAAGLAAADPAEQLLSAEDLANKFVSIPGMDGFFVYQIHYKTRVYQYHKEHIGVETKVTEDHVLGVYDAAATEAARKRDETAKISEAGTAWLEQQAELQPAASQGSKNKDEAAAGNTANDAGQEADSQQQQATGDGSASEAAAAESGSGSNKAADSPELPAGPHYPPSMLELLDYLPDTAPMIHSWWPYYRQMYTGGEKCAGEGGGKPRQVELRIACSPHLNSWRLLVREPEFCNYVVVMYHPGLCQLPRYKPVPKPKPGAKAKKKTVILGGSNKQKGSSGGTNKQEGSSSGKSEEKGKFGDKIAAT